MTYTQHAPLLLQSFAAMSPLDQALHLVYDHGFDSAMFTAVSPGHPFEQLFGTDDAVVQAFAIGDFEATDTLSEGYSFPCALGRVDWHAGDHAEYRGNDSDWPSSDPDTRTLNAHDHE